MLITTEPNLIWSKSRKDFRRLFWFDHVTLIFCENSKLFKSHPKVILMSFKSFKTDKQKIKSHPGWSIQRSIFRSLIYLTKLIGDRSLVHCPHMFISLENGKKTWLNLPQPGFEPILWIIFPLTFWKKIFQQFFSSLIEILMRLHIVVSPIMTEQLTKECDGRVTAAAKVI